MAQRINQFNMKSLCVITPCTCTGTCIQMSHCEHLLTLIKIVHENL